MTSDLSKIYENLTSQQLAVLVFNHIADSDDLERQRILSVVPKGTYQLNNWDFIRHSSILESVAHVIGITYWQAQAYFFMRSFAWLHQQHQTESKQLDDDAVTLAYRDIANQTKTAAAKLLGTELAINDFIDRHGLDRAVIQAMTMTPKGFNVSKAVEAVQPCFDNYNIVTDLLEGMMAA